MSTKSGRAAPMHPDDRRRAIIDAVVPLLVEHGLAVSTRQIAEAAGIAEGTIFRVFPDKNALLMAAAAQTLNPADGRADLASALAGLDDLHDKVRVTAEHMGARSERVMAVMMPLRRAWAAQGEHLHGRPAGPGQLAGPPDCVLDAHAALLDQLTEVFEPHRDELAVPPQRAALLLRTLVLGSRHPSARPQDRLTGDEVADVLLRGICRSGVPRKRA